jgi:hypothetical protein
VAGEAAVNSERSEFILSISTRATSYGVNELWLSGIMLDSAAVVEVGRQDIGAS